VSSKRDQLFSLISWRKFHNGSPISHL
jgi:hypothetical protein